MSNAQPSSEKGNDAVPTSETSLIDDAQHFFEKHLTEDGIDNEQTIYILRNLIEIVRIINSHLETKNLLEAILYSFVGQFGSLNSAIFLYNDLLIDMPVYELEAFVGLDIDPFPLAVSESDPLITFLRTDIPWINIDDQLHDEEYENFRALNELLKGSLIFPLKSKEKLNGFVLLGNKLDGKKYLQAEYLYMSLFAELIGISVENLMLSKLVVLDRMTKIFNHQYFQDRVKEEIDRVHRYKQLLTLIMIDIDYFKKFNDTYGHQMGDRLLKELALLLKNNVRNADIVARYGGEEFAILLPECTIECGSNVAEKIRKLVEENEFCHDQEISCHVTISLGLSTVIPDITDRADSLIKQADSALYKSKDSGRNCVTIFDGENYRQVK